MSIIDQWKKWIDCFQIIDDLTSSPPSVLLFPSSSAELLNLSLFFSPLDLFSSSFSSPLDHLIKTTIQQQSQQQQQQQQQPDQLSKKNSYKEEKRRHQEKNDLPVDELASEEPGWIFRNNLLARTWVGWPARRWPVESLTSLSHSVL